jgi:hypothetical protein
MKKRLSYTVCKDGHYVVMCGKTALGCIEPKGEVFKKRVVFHEDVLDGAEWTGECLIELGTHMLSLEKRKREHFAQQPLPVKSEAPTLPKR